MVFAILTIDTVKLWDIRKFTAPIARVDGLCNYFEETNISYSPNDNLIITGTSVKKNDPNSGKIAVFNSSTLEMVKQVPLKGSTSVIRVIWHERINQIAASLSDFSVHVLYDPMTSVRGAKLCAAKAVRTKRADDYDYAAGFDFYSYTV